MTKLQTQILDELEQRSLFDIAQGARHSWENGSRYYCRQICPFELRLKFAEGNRDLVVSQRQPSVLNSEFVSS